MFEGYEIASLTARASDLASGRGQADVSNLRGTFKAQVVDVQPGKVTLNIEGRTVTAETSMQLTPDAEYDVVVKGFNGNKVQLQIVTGMNADGAQAETQSSRPLTDGEIPSRLMGFDLPEHASTAPIARALMNAGLPVSRENMTALIQAAPQQATDKELGFLVTMMKNGQNPSREALALMPLLDSEIKALPKNMSAVFDLVAKNPGAFDKLFDLAGKIRDSALDGLAMKNLGNVLIKPDTEAAAAAADKLQTVGKQFFTASEARLAFLDNLKAALSPQADSAAKIAGRLTTLLQLLPQEPSETPNTLLDNAIKNALNTIRDMISNIPAEPVPEPAASAPAQAPPAQTAPQPAPPAPAAAEQSPAPPGPQTVSVAEQQQPPAASEPEQAQPAPIRAALDAMGADLFKNIQQQMQSADSPAQKYFAIRETITDALSKIFESMLNARPAPGQDVLPEKFQQLPQRLENIVNTLKDIVAQQQQQAGKAPAPISAATVAKLADELAPLLTMKFNEQALPNTQKLLESALQLLQQQQQPATPQQHEDRAALLMRQLADPALQQEIQQLASHLRDGGDIRAALNTLAQNAATQDSAGTALSLARNIQFAALSNLIAHNGAAPTEAFVTFFPIQVGDRVEIGRLKVFRNTNPDDKTGKTKQIDPNNATLVIFLDTQFIGHSAIKINTYQHKLNCAIEVENKRVKKILDRFIPELKEALANTPFDLENVSVNVLRPRAAAKAEEQKKESPPITTIDMKI